MSNATIKAHATRLAVNSANTAAQALIRAHEYQLREIHSYSESLAAALDANDLRRAATVIKNMIHYQSVNVNHRLDLLAASMVELHAVDHM